MNTNQETLKEINVITPFKNANERLLFGYLSACNINFAFQKNIYSPFAEKLCINFEINISGYTVFIELIESPEKTAIIKQQYKTHFLYPIVFCIDVAKPAHEFYEQLVSIFTGLIPLTITPTLSECLLQDTSAEALNFKMRT